MKAEYALAKLTAGALVMTGGGGSAHNRLTASDVAHAMGGMKTAPTALLLAKYVDRDSNYKHLLRFAQQQSHALATAEDWRVHKISILDSVARVAVEEMLSIGQCRKCQGTGYVKSDPDSALCPSEVCPTCDGVGTERWTKLQRAKAAGLEPKFWNQQWNERYLHLLAELRQWEQDGLAYLNRRLKGWGRQ